MDATLSESNTKRTIALSILVTLLSLISIQSAEAQTWRQLGYPLPPWTDLRCAYFWDTAHGVVGGVGALYNYNSGVWTEGRYPEGVPIIIKSLRLLDGYGLYAASGYSCIWKSTDHGVTWEKTSALFPNADDINISWQGIRGVNSSGTGMLQGTTFAHTNPHLGDTCIIAKDSDAHIILTIDGGANYNTLIPTQFKSGYSCVSDTCMYRCYVMSDGPDAILYVTSDKGYTWIPRTDFGTTANDVLEGATGGVLYVQGPKNVWRSTSSGKTWENIGGPGFNLGDRRMFTFGPYNRWLVVMDSSQVYLWDGGTNYLPTGPMPKVLDVKDVNDTDCTFPQCTVNLRMQSQVDTVHLHAFTRDGSTIQPTDTTVILPAGTGSLPVSFRTSVPFQQFNTTFYFRDTVTGTYECGQFRYAEDTFAVVRFPSYPTNILHVSNLTDTGCSLSSLSIYLDKTSNPDTVRLHAHTNNGLTIEPRDTTLIVPAGTGQLPIRYRASMHPFQFSATFYFEDTVSGRYKCGHYKFVTDSSIVVRLYPPKQPAKYTLHSPYKISTCSDYRFPLVVRAPNTCDSLRLDSLTWYAPSLSQNIDHLPHSLGPDEPDTFWVTISARTPGVYDNVFFLHGSTTVAPHSMDTVLYYTVTAAPAHGDVRATSPSKLTLSNCSSAVVPFYLHALSCDSVKVLTATTTLLNTIQYSTNLSFPRNLGPATDDTLLVTIPPQGLNGAYIVSARVTGRYAGSSVTFDTTLQVRVTFTNSQGGLIPNDEDINVDTLTVCDVRDTVASFANVSCDTIVVTGDQTVWQAGWSADDPSFPFSLAPNSSFSVPLHFKPSGLAVTSYQFLTYRFTNAGGKSGNSADSRLTATTLPAPITIHLSDTALYFGVSSRCASYARDTTVSLINTGCDSLRVTNVMVSGDPNFTLSSAHDTLLASGESARVTIHFENTSIGNVNGAVHIHAATQHGGIPIDTILTLSASITPGTKTLAASLERADLGEFYLCQARDTTVWLRNSGCDTVQVDSAMLEGEGGRDATLHAKTSFPLRVPPDSLIPITLSYAPDTTGHPSSIAGTMVFYSNSDSLKVIRIPFFASVVYPGRLHVSLSKPQQAASNALVTYSVLVSNEGIRPTAITGVYFDLTHNNDLLSFVSASGSLQQVQQSGSPEATRRTFEITPLSTLDTIGTLTFQVFLTDTSTTNLEISNVHFDNPLGLAPDCIASVADSGSNFQYTYSSCGEGYMQDVLSGGSFSITSIVPNPAREEIVVRVVKQVSGAIRYELVDVLGRAVLSRSFSVIPPEAGGEASLHADISGFPSGVYNLRVSQGRFVQTRRVVIER